MQERHQNRKKYFDEQIITTQKYVVPYIQNHLKINQKTRVLEIGCGEGGNLKPFLDLNCEVVGVDLALNKINIGNDIFSSDKNSSNIKLLCEDIYNLSSNDIGTFDIIFMRDVIEHIHNQERFMAYVKPFLKDNGVFFLGFPPWQNPFGGHQQICKSKIGSKLPFYHLLPTFLYKGILKLFGESEKTIDALIEIKETGISIERFERILKTENYKVVEKTHFLINPNYEIKFGLKPKKQFAVISTIPFLRNYFTTAVYYLIKK